MSPVVGTERNGSLGDASEQFTLIPVGISAGDKRLAEEGQVLGGIIAAKFHNLANGQLVATFAIPMPGVALQPLSTDAMP